MDAGDGGDASKKRKMPDDDGDAAPEFACSVCMELNTEPVTFTCGHAACAQCKERDARKSTVPCPECRATVASEHVFRRGGASELDYDAPIVNKLALSAVRAAVGTVQFDAAVAQQAAERAERARARADAVYAIIVAALSDSGGGGVALVVISHARVQKLTSESHLQLLLAAHVRSGALGCTREWSGRHYPPPATTTTTTLVDDGDALYYLNERFDAVAFAMVRMFRRDSFISEERTKIVAMLLNHARRIVMAPERYKTTQSVALSWLRAIGEYIDANFTTFLRPSTIRLVEDSNIFKKKCSECEQPACICLSQLLSSSDGV
jgi:hypothetical protein